MEQLKNFGRDKDKYEDHFIQLSNQISELEGVIDEFKKKYEEEKRILKEFVYPEDEEMRERIIRYYKIRERKRIAKLKRQAELEERQKEKEEKGDEDSEEEEE